MSVFLGCGMEEGDLTDEDCVLGVRASRLDFRVGMRMSSKVCHFVMEAPEVKYADENEILTERDTC